MCWPWTTNPTPLFNVVPHFCLPLYQLHPRGKKEMSVADVLFCLSFLRTECPESKILTVEYPCVRAGGKNSTCFRWDTRSAPETKTSHSTSFIPPCLCRAVRLHTVTVIQSDGQWRDTWCLMSVGEMETKTSCVHETLSVTAKPSCHFFKISKVFPKITHLYKKEECTDGLFVSVIFL